MDPVSLLVAFREIGPIQTLPAGTTKADADRIRMDNERRQRAAARLLNELQVLAAGLAREFSGRESLLKDAIQVTLLVLAQSGPRGERERDPGDEKAVRRYLWTALRHNAISLLRREREVGLGDIPAVDSEAGTEASVLLGLGLQRAKTRLFDQIIPTVADDIRTDSARESFLTAIQQLRSIAEGDADFEDILRSEVEADCPSGASVESAGVEAPDGEEGRNNGRAVVRARNRLHKRYSRVLTDLSEAVSMFAYAESLTRDEEDNLRRWLDWLRLGRGQ